MTDRTRKLLAAEYAPKSTYIQIRVSPEQADAWQAAANAAGLKLSKWIRKSCDLAAHTGTDGAK